MSTIEWQKRGLPHSHTLIWCKEKIRPNQVDQIISAEIPDPEEDPDLFDVVKTQMVHVPCGQVNRKAPCMEDNKCSKRYPRDFLQETQTGQDGYPLYRRRKPEDGGRTCPKKIRGSPQPLDIDNCWIILYNPLLSKIFKAHINVEFCNSVKSIKYVCKYVNKGSDMAAFGIESDSLDEVSKFVVGRYISSNEAAWRIMEFPIHHRHPTVERLAVHLENGQRVYFTEETARQRVEHAPATTLTEFFKLCETDAFARTLLYGEVPTY